MSTSGVLKVLKLGNFQNSTSDHKSSNARAGSYDFLFIIYLTKLLRRSSLHALHTTSKALQCYRVVRAHIFQFLGLLFF